MRSQASGRARHSGRSRGDYLELLIEVLAKNVRPKSPTYTNHRSRYERAVPRICSQMHRSMPSRRSCRTFERGCSHERANHETRPTCQLAWRRRQADQCNRRSRLRRGGSRTAAKRWLISLRVSGIWSAGAGGPRRRGRGRGRRRRWCASRCRRRSRSRRRARCPGRRRAEAVRAGWRSRWRGAWRWCGRRGVR